MDEETTKVCFKCGRTLPLGDFYKHPQMADGHLNKCKECTKSDVHNKYMDNIENPEYVEKERARGREKWDRLYKGKCQQSIHSVGNVRRYVERRIGCLPKDTELHHWNYSYLYKVFILSRRHHARIHKLIEFDQESQCFTYEGKLLDTMEEHEKIIKIAMPNEPYQYLEL